MHVGKREREKKLNVVFLTLDAENLVFAYYNKYQALGCFKIHVLVMQFLLLIWILHAASEPDIYHATWLEDSMIAIRWGG